MKILPPSTGYEPHGVTDYWVVNGDAGWVMVYRLEADGRYGKPDYYRRNEAIRNGVLGGAEIATDDFLIPSK